MSLTTSSTRSVVKAMIVSCWLSNQAQFVLLVGVIFSNPYLLDSKSVKEVRLAVIERRTGTT